MHKEIEQFMNWVRKRNPEEKEFIQAVEEVAEDIIPYIQEHPEYKKLKIFERLTEPDRIIQFRVSWVNDKGEVEINRGYRVQFNSAIGPYKGGLRFHPSVNLSILKFLAFEQIFKNALTTLPMGGGKGGSDFNPKGKSDTEIMRFSQAFMSELFRHIGPNIDVPAGDIGVGIREIGYLFGQYKKLKNEFSGVLTGKGIAWGGSLIRPEATGYGLVYFVENMLQTKGEKIFGKQILISGSGNVAQYAAEKAIELGAKVLTLSDSNGYIFDPNGIDKEKLEFIKKLKNEKRGRIREYAEQYEGVSYYENKKPWGEQADIALPCATQNEILKEDAERMIENGIFCVAEGANMPSHPDAIRIFKKEKILYAPGKASNAGGVATSGLEITQNALHYSWTRKEVDKKLKEIMKTIHDTCTLYGKDENGDIDYVKGANIAAFEKVAQAMKEQGVI